MQNRTGPIHIFLKLDWSNSTIFSNWTGPIVVYISDQFRDTEGIHFALVFQGEFTPPQLQYIAARHNRLRERTSAATVCMNNYFHAVKLFKDETYGKLDVRTACSAIAKVLVSRYNRTGPIAYLLQAATYDAKVTSDNVQKWKAVYSRLAGANQEVNKCFEELYRSGYDGLIQNMGVGPVTKLNDEELLVFLQAVMDKWKTTKTTLSTTNTWNMGILAKMVITPAWQVINPSAAKAEEKIKQ